MLRLIGGLMVVGACTALSSMCVQNYVNRPRQLRELQSALSLLETEIDYSSTPLPEALERVAASCREPVAQLFARAFMHLRGGRGYTAAEAWHAAVGEVYPRTALAPADREVLQDMAYSLGASHRSDQIRHLKEAREQLKRLEAQAREEEHRNARLFGYLGFFAGTLVVILLY